MMGLFRKRQKITTERLCTSVFVRVTELTNKNGAAWAEQGLLTSNPRVIAAFRTLGKDDKGDVFISILPSPSDRGFPKKKVSDTILKDEFFRIRTELYTFYLFLFDLIVQKEFGRHAGGALREFLHFLHYRGGWSKEEADSLVDFMEKRWEDYAKAFAEGPMRIGSFAASCIIGSEAKDDVSLVALFATQVAAVLKTFGNIGKDYELTLA